MKPRQWTSTYAQPVSYDGCEADIDGVHVTIRESDVFKLDLDTAERLIADLDAAILQSRRGVGRLMELLDPAISDREAHERLERLNEPTWTRPGTSITTCMLCGHTLHHSVCVDCECEVIAW